MSCTLDTNTAYGVPRNFAAKLDDNGDKYVLGLKQRLANLIQFLSHLY